MAAARRLLSHLAQAPLVLLVLCTASFVLMRAAPGGPFSGERGLPPGVKEALEQQYHLDAPVTSQYVYFLGDLVRGDLGPSMRYPGQPVSTIIADRLPKSLLLGGAALLVAVVMGLTAGVIAASRHNKLGDHLAMAGALAGMSLPVFVLGPLLLLVFQHHLGWSQGPGTPLHFVLAAFALGAPFAARIARLSRAGMLEVLHQDWVRTARAKGLSETAVVVKHAMRGGLIPVVAYLGPASALLLTGSLVVEKVFLLPGLGREFIESALNRDYTLAMGTVIVYGIAIIVCNLLADLAQWAMDPRLRHPS